MKKYLISLQYDGTDYSGFAKQNNTVKTIYDVLFNAIKLILKKVKFKLKYASRTDAGTHALDQKCLLIIPFEIKSIKQFLETLNTILPTTIYANSIFLQNINFDIKSYKIKKYQYCINKSNNHNIFSSRKELNLSKSNFNYFKFKRILKIFVGNHDYYNFCKLDKTKNINTERKINKITCKRKKDKILISFFAYGFIRYQIRYIIGSSIAYSESKISLNDLKLMLKIGKDKKIINKFRAPSKGLILLKIIY